MIMMGRYHAGGITPQGILGILLQLGWITFCLLLDWSVWKVGLAAE
jgi:hypothetical protein